MGRTIYPFNSLSYLKKVYVPKRNEDEDFVKFIIKCASEIGDKVKVINYSDGRCRIVIKRKED